MPAKYAQKFQISRAIFTINHYILSKNSKTLHVLDSQIA